VQLLLEKGADIKAKTNYRSTALDLAAENMQDVIVKLLKQTQPSLYQRLKLSARRG